MSSWSTKAGQLPEAVTESLKRETPLAVVSAITKLTAPSSRKGKKVSLREVPPLPGYICISETPDSEGCGLIKNFAMTCSISLDKSADEFFKAMKKIGPRLSAA